MSKIPIAEEMLYQKALEYAKRSSSPEKFHESMALTLSGIPFKEEDKFQKDAMIAFAKLHVKAALEAAAKNGKAHNGGTYNDGECLATQPAYIDKDSILNAYPDKLII